MEAQQELFERRYAQIAGTDRVGWSDEVTSAFAIGMFQKQLTAVGLSGGDLVELGCGRGNIALAFARLGWRSVGVDFAPTAVRWAQEFATEQGLEAEFRVADLREPWPFDTESFDAVLDANCLHFFHGDNRRRFLDEAHRVLRPSGYFLVSTIVNQPDPEHWEMLRYDPDARITRQDGVPLNCYVDAPDLIGELAEAGFRVVSSVVESRDHPIMWATLRKSM
ncbi:MAG: class I SAM-dependent methyltransferase [Armatimonadetes bacterium]|nr:class I SAM-dependent methyltransferase [Armatimonadota bacterium]MBS1729085.1 class I SAM-dependent methyltransferase [Armatimonadota bacterium]